MKVEYNITRFNQMNLLCASGLVKMIRASLSEPHINGKYMRELCIHSYIPLLAGAIAVDHRAKGIVSTTFTIIGSFYVIIIMNKQ